VRDDLTGSVPSSSAHDGNRARPLVSVLARYRVFLGFVFGAAALWWSTPTVPLLELGAALAAAGEAIRIWAAGHLNKSREVTSSGPYRWMSHPLYVGSSVMGAGLAVASGSVAVAVLVGSYLAIALTIAAKNEEAVLRQKFGDDYDRYQRGAVDRARRFSWSQALANREHRAVIGLLAAAGLLALKAWRSV